MLWKPILIAAILAAPLPALAQPKLTQLQASVAAELPHYGFRDVDVTTLSSGTLAHINHLLHSDKSVAQIRGNIGAVLGDSALKTLFGRR